MRAGIVFKMVAWCLLLVAVYLGAMGVLYSQVERIGGVSGELVRVNHVVDLSAKQMMDHLLSYEENRRTFEILGKEKYREYYRANWVAYGELLDSVLALGVEDANAWQGLRDQYREAEEPLSEAVVGGWLEALSGLRHANNRLMESRLIEIDGRVERVVSLGLAGLVVLLVVGVGGSLLMALGMNRSLKEIRSGFAALGRGRAGARVTVRTRDEFGLLAERFNAMAERLEREERMRSDFISMLSHEIRTPLTSIRESVSLVADGTLGEVGEKQRRFLELSKREMERLSELLSRLMRVSRLESGKLELSLSSMDVRELVEDTVERMRGAALSKRMELEAELPSEPCEVVADAPQLRQVLLNLLGNAVKFSSEGSRVRVRVNGEGDAARGGVSVCVRDEGPGIPEEDRDHVFEKYYRGAGARESVDGAGLGLSISRAVVEAHGGRMWLECGQELGCCFCFSVPKATGGPS